MKTSNLQKLFWVFFALIVTTASVSAQGSRNGNRVQKNQNLPCVEQISNLTDEQIQEIEKLEASHQGTMEALRTKRRSTVNAIEKNEIRTEMLKRVEAHQNEVKGLLTADQKEEYDLLQNRSGNFYKQHGRNSAGNYGRQNGPGCRGNGKNVGTGRNGQRGNNCIQRGGNGNGNRGNGSFRGKRSNSCRFNS